MFDVAIVRQMLGYPVRGGSPAHAFHAKDMEGSSIRGRGLNTGIPNIVRTITFAKSIMIVGTQLHLENPKSESRT